MGNSSAKGIKHGGRNTPAAETPLKHKEEKKPAAKTPIKGFSECLQIQEHVTDTYILAIEGWSKLNVQGVASNNFGFGDHKWYVGVNPKGFGSSKGKHMSVYIGALESCLPRDKQVYISYTITLKDQLHGNHKSHTGRLKFKKKKKSSGTNFTIYDFLPLEELNDMSRGFLVNDACIFEVDVTFIGYSSRS